jgi:hypothetical protein
LLFEDKRSRLNGFAEEESEIKSTICRSFPEEK